jgi:hypothetical protein
LESQIIYRKYQKLKNANGNMNTFLHCVWNKDIQYVCLIGEWWWNNCYTINLYMCIVSLFIHRHHHNKTLKKKLKTPYQRTRHAQDKPDIVTLGTCVLIFPLLLLETRKSCILYSPIKPTKFNKLFVPDT